MRTIAFILSLFAAIGLMAEDIYVSQTGAGGQTGADCANAHSGVWFNTAGNWGAGAGKISAGDTVHICGTWTGTNGDQFLVFKGSGSAGSPITILFESGAQFTAPVWMSGNVTVQSGAIYSNGKSYFIIDGGDGTNGLIECTDNGTASKGFTYSSNSCGIHIVGGSNVEVRNFRIYNIYQGTGEQPGSTTGMGIAAYNCDSVNIHHCAITNVGFGINVSMQTDTNIQVCSNITYRVGQPFRVGTATTNATGDNILVKGNWCSGNTNWNYNDGIKIFGSGVGVDAAEAITRLIIDGNQLGPDISGPGSACTGSIVCDHGWIDSPKIINNVMIGSPTEHVDDGYITSGGMLHVALVGRAVVANNTVYTQETNTFIFMYFDYGGIHMTNYNNICYAPNCNNILWCVWQNETNVTIDASDYNIFYAPNAKLQCQHVNGSGVLSIYTLAQYQSIFGLDAHSLTISPLLNPSTYVPYANSPARDAGLDVTAFGVTNDFLGNTRVLPLDIGALEFISGGPPPQPTNGTSTSLISFIQRRIDSRTTTFYVTNSGTDTLLGTASVATAYFTLSGGTNYSLTPGQTSIIAVVFGPISQGTYNDTITLTGGGGAAVLLSGNSTNFPTASLVGKVSTTGKVSIQ